MQLFTKLEPLIKAGVVMRLTIKAVGDNMQVDILPECDTGKTGIAIPPRAFMASAAELDAEFPGVLDTYVPSAVGLTEQIAVTQAILDKATAEAKEASAKAAEARTTSGSTPARPAKAGAAAAPKKRNMNAGFDDDDEDDTSAGGGEGDPATTPTESVAQAPVTSGEPAVAGGAQAAPQQNNVFL